MNKGVYLGVILTVPLFSQAGTPDNTALPDGPGKAVVQRMCVGCHSLKVVTSKRATPNQWNDLVQLMVSRGADGSDEDIDTVIKYLSTHFGPDAKPETPGSATHQAAPSSTVATPAKDTESASPSATDTTVNVNTATAQQLESSLGLSEQEAQAVVHYREHNGNFKDWHGVAAVPGVSAERIEENHNRITF